MPLIINNLQLDLDMKIMSELSKIDRFDASWSNIEKRESSTLMQLKSIATVKSVGASTRIEGSKMTDDEVSVLIEVGTRFDNSFGGKLLSDRISNEVMELVRTRQDGYLDLLPDWYVIRTLMESTNTIEQLIDTGLLVRRLIRFTFKLQQGI